MEMVNNKTSYAEREYLRVGPSKSMNRILDMDTNDLDQMIEKAGENGTVGRAEVYEEEKKAPYSFLAVTDPGGQKYIEHKGVIFLCDDQHQALTLGDMSNPDQVLTIPLEKGGCLKVNRANLGDLADAIDMFSPQDVGRIMRAITTDTRTQQLKHEIEEEKNSVVNLG